MKRIPVTVMLLGMFAVAAMADIARPDAKPKKQTSVDTTLRIKLDQSAKEARLIVPKSQLKALRAAIDEADGGPAELASVGGVSRVQTIAGGLFLSLAFVFGGVWLIRARATGGESGKVAVGVATVALLCSGATLVWANMGPPAEARSITGKMFSQAVHIYKFGYGKVKLETTDENSDQILLIVPDPPDATPTPAE